MKKILFLMTLCGGLTTAVAQRAESVEQVLQSIERNNKTLQSAARRTDAKKMETRVDNNLQNPEVEYTYQFSNKENPTNQSELNVTQSFEFPTRYAARGRYGKLQRRAYDRQLDVERRDILLQAKELCLQLVRLNKQKELLRQRQANVDELAELFDQRLQTGDANVLEVNKVKLERMEVTAEVAQNDADCCAALQQLVAMNDNQPISFDGVTYPVLPEFVAYDALRDTLQARDYEMQSALAQQDAAHRAVKVSKQGWLPDLTVGYRRSGLVGAEAHGFIVGASIPLFANQGKVKQSRMESLSADYEAEQVQSRTEAERRALYNEVCQLKRAMEGYDVALMNRTLTYLGQALMAGQISVIQYFTEVGSINDNQQKYLELEYAYQLAMSRLYKNFL